MFASARAYSSLPLLCHLDDQPRHRTPKPTSNTQYIVAEQGRRINRGRRALSSAPTTQPRLRSSGRSNNGLAANPTCQGVCSTGQRQADEVLGLSSWQACAEQQRRGQMSQEGPQGLCLEGGQLRGALSNNTEGNRKQGASRAGGTRNARLGGGAKAGLRDAHR